jgi:hypothetical protein
MQSYNANIEGDLRLCLKAWFHKYQKETKSHGNQALGVKYRHSIWETNVKILCITNAKLQC